MALQLRLFFAKATFICCFAVFIATVAYGKSSEEEKNISEAWRTPVHLLFCRHGNHSRGNQIVGHVFFRPPPAPPKWKLWRLLVRLVCLDSLSHSLKAHVELPTYVRAFGAAVASTSWL
uniref:Histidine phosphatase family protein n=1 Tax=Macrostomum lignano TaxID=282301 RepID=A0A1I8G8L8_9PLAT